MYKISNNLPLESDNFDTYQAENQIFRLIGLS